ncbi:transposase [Caballeronia sp. dw_19]|uniref:transposase n=1 Tax=Caballeronia sp. dw_19 TaxID=2719791 RepID=UPI001BD5606B|nr:transposase [Caballeronia sp. dw_19]
MRGADTFAENLFTLRKLEDFVPADHPLRSIRKMANAALAKMDRLFAGMYEADIKGGRPSIAPEKLLRAMLLQVLYSVRSERQLMEQVQYNLLFRWFIGLSMDDAVWVPTVFTEFIKACQEMNITPHVAQNKSGRQSAVPESIAGSAGYAVSQQKRKLIEQGFGWAKSIGGMRQLMVRGLKKVDQMFVLTMAAYNLVRMRTLGQLRALQPQ